MNAGTAGGEGWPEYQRLVLKTLSDLTDGQQRVEDKLEALTIDVAMLKVKAGVWGAAAGMVPALAILLLGLAGGG